MYFIHFYTIIQEGLTFNKLVSKQYDFYYTIVFLIPFPIISTTGNQPINNIAYANIILFTSFIGGYVAANFPKNF